jgi:hypothetical protein
MPLEIVRIPVLSDNYVWLVHEPVSGETMAVDPAVAEPVLAEAQQRGSILRRCCGADGHRQRAICRNMRLGLRGAGRHEEGGDEHRNGLHDQHTDLIGKERTTRRQARAYCAPPAFR